MHNNRIFLRAKCYSSDGCPAKVLESVEKEAVCLFAPVGSQDIGSLKIDRIQRKVKDKFLNPDLPARFGHDRFQFFRFKDQVFPFPYFISPDSLSPGNYPVILCTDTVIPEWLPIRFMEQPERDRMVPDHRMESDRYIDKSDGNASTPEWSSC